MPPEPKTCVSCGRTITWRKKWERDWEQVRYCSTACRRRGVSESDTELEQRIVSLLATRRTISIAEVGDDEPARRAARRLVDRGEVEIVQRGRVVDPSTARGQFEIRRTR